MTTASPVAPAASTGTDAVPFRPLRMAEVELTRPLPNLPGDRSTAWLLVRLHTEPIGSVEVPVAVGGLSGVALAEIIWSRLRGPIVARFHRAGIPAPNRVPPGGFELEQAGSPFLRERERVLATAPTVTVVVCTRDRADRLGACLDRLSAQQYPAYEIVVVDNAPRTDHVRRLVAARTGEATTRYVVEPRPGLSWARNTGAAHARGDVVAFLDDDEAPDAHWLAEIARGFAAGPDVGCVSGMILPARIDTQAQAWFEQFGGHSKGRGFSPALFSADGEQSPLYPLPPFGAGGNMAFRRAALCAIGGFDVALGAGTPAGGGEDTLAITLVMLAGYRVAYQPAAFVRHDHYAGLDGLAQQLHGYGLGLTAYYTALLRHRPGLLVPLLRLAPRALRDLRGKDSLRTAGMRDFPARLTRLQRRGMLLGPAAYARSRRAQRRLRTAEDAE